MVLVITKPNFIEMYIFLHIFKLQLYYMCMLLIYCVENLLDFDGQKNNIRLQIPSVDQVNEIFNSMIQILGFVVLSIIQ